MSDKTPNQNKSDAAADKSLTALASPILREQEANANESFFPGYVPITEQFGGDPSVPLPDDFLDAHWWKATGQQLHMDAFRDAASKYRKEQKEHEALLAFIEEENKIIDLHNKELRLEYDKACLHHQQQLETHQRELDAYKRDDERARREYNDRRDTWHMYSVLTDSYPLISRALLWQIHKRSLCFTATGVFWFLAIAAGIARLYFTFALICPLWDRPWYVILTTIIACQCCYLLFWFFFYQTYCSRWTELLEQEGTSPTLITELRQWRQMHNRLCLNQGSRRAKLDFLFGGSQLPTLFVPQTVTFKNGTVSKPVPPANCLDHFLHVRLGWFLSLIPVVSLLLFVIVFFYVVSGLQDEKDFLNDIKTYSSAGFDSLRNKLGTEPPSQFYLTSPPSAPSPPRLTLLAHKPLPAPPKFIPPPKPTRPK